AAIIGVDLYPATRIDQYSEFGREFVERDPSVLRRGEAVEHLARAPAAGIDPARDQAEPFERLVAQLAINAQRARILVGIQPQIAALAIDIHILLRAVGAAADFAAERDGQRAAFVVEP